MIQVQMLADSVNPSGSRITSWMLTYPRFIHAEFMTHRVFSRNSASSRAIPTKKLLEDIRKNPATFEQIGRANKGMSAQEVCTPEESVAFHARWKYLARHMSDIAEAWSLGFAKQVVNRVVEPWMHISVLATATDHSNFFKLRANPMAQPEFQVLAYRMLELYLKSNPNPLEWGDWHMPVFDNYDAGWTGDIEKNLAIATARCARLSYMTFDGKHSVQEDIDLHNKLVKSGHWSPFEHCAIATRGDYSISNFDIDGMPVGWRQYRKQFPQESGRGVDLSAIMQEKPDWIIL